MWDGVDRRRFPRAEYPCLITIRKNTAPPAAILTHTENISVVGMRVIIRKEIKLMTEVDIDVDLKDTLPTIFSKGAIKWVKEVPSGSSEGPLRYDTGINFIALKDEYRRRIQRIVDHLLSKGG